MISLSLHHDNRRTHIGVDVAMIGKCASALERESKGAADRNGTTIKRLPVVTGYRVGYRRNILPYYSRTHLDRKLCGTEAEAPITVVDDRQDLS